LASRSAKLKILLVSGEAYTSPLPPETFGSWSMAVSSSLSTALQSTPMRPSSVPIRPPSASTSA